MSNPPLPGEYEIDLYRIANGEPIKWFGMASGEVDRVQGLALVAAAAAMALASTGVAMSGAAELIGWLRRGGAEFDVGLIFAALSLLGVLGAAGVALLGVKFLKDAKRVVWAVTTKRLIRMVGGEADKARSWRKDAIRKVERLKWRSSAREGLAVSVVSRRRGDAVSVLVILGPGDLDAAEKALGELES